MDVSRDDLDSLPVPDTPSPLERNDVAFDAPWQARAFALVVALYDRSDREWSDFQQRLVDRLGEVDARELDADVENVYYREWLESLEELAVEEGVVSPVEIDRRQEEFSEGHRDESEFVDGDPAH